MSDERLGYVGTGIMGAPMVRNLLRAGHKVTVWNRTPEKARALESDGAVVASSPREVAASADIVFACLFDGKSVAETLRRDDGILRGLSQGAVFVDMTTNNPKLSAELAQEVQQAGGAMLDAPVSGGDAGAKSGTLSIMVGGAVSTFERVLPYLEVLGQRITHMGSEVGAGGYAKLANQMMVPIHLAAMCEAMVFAERAGVDKEKLLAALQEGLAGSRVLSLKGARLLTRDFTPGGEARLLLKDLRYVEEAMDQLGFRLPVTDLVTRLLERLDGAGLARDDAAGFVRLFEGIASGEAPLNTKER